MGVGSVGGISYAVKKLLKLLAKKKVITDKEKEDIEKNKKEDKFVDEPKNLN